MRSIIGRQPRCRNTSASSARSARFRARCPRRCGSSGNVSQSLTVAPERPRPGHLYASHLSQAGYAGRPHLFIVGLEEGRVFSSSTEDAVLLDAERAAISADLRLSTDRIDEAVYAVLSRLAVSGRDRRPSATPVGTRASSAKHTRRG